MRWLSAPRLFEVGRTKAFDFSRAPTPVEDMDGDSAPGFRAVALRPRTLPCSPHELATCAVIHPSSTAMYPEPAARWIQGGFLIVVGALLLGGLANGTVSRVAAWVTAGAVSISQRRLRRSIAVPVALLGLALIVVAYHFPGALARATQRNDQATTASDRSSGVSIWLRRFDRSPSGLRSGSSAAGARQNAISTIRPSFKWWRYARSNRNEGTVRVGICMGAAYFIASTGRSRLGRPSAHPYGKREKFWAVHVLGCCGALLARLPIPGGNAHVHRP
jgi:hypothetical protein